MKTKTLIAPKYVSGAGYKCPHCSKGLMWHRGGEFSCNHCTYAYKIATVIDNDPATDYKGVIVE